MYEFGPIVSSTVKPLLDHLLIFNLMLEIYMF